MRILLVFLGKRGAGDSSGSPAESSCLYVIISVVSRTLQNSSGIVGLIKDTLNK